MSLKQFLSDIQCGTELVLYPFRNLGALFEQVARGPLRLYLELLFVREFSRFSQD